MEHLRQCAEYKKKKQKLGKGIVKQQNLRAGAVEPVPPPACPAPPSSPYPPAGPPPPPLLPDELRPGGRLHCGGDLVFTMAKLKDGRRPLFLMPPGAVAIFKGATFRHGTTEHDDEQARPKGCAAHISFANQTPAQVLRLTGSQRRAMHERLITAGEADAEEFFQDAIRVPVLVLEDQAGGGEDGFHTRRSTGHQPTRLAFNERWMHALPWTRIVLYDRDTLETLVMYDASGGLGQRAAKFASATFSFLHNFEFTLNRAAGDLGLDGKGEQRMLMLGLHQWRRNLHQPPDRRRKLSVASKGGDIDAYVIHYDEPVRLAPSKVKKVFNSISDRMRALMPNMCAVLEQVLVECQVKERCYTHNALDHVSDDLLVHNVGASSAYQSPAHVDAGDVGWTFAWACKCCRGCRVT